MKSKQKICNRCNNLSYIWKNDKGSRYCKSCWQIISMSDKKPTVKKQKPIAHRSSKRSAQEREYMKLRNKFLVSHPLCQAKISGVCTIHSTDVHHMKGRIANLLTDEKYFLSVCRSCHNWIELNPAIAKELGLSISRI